MLSFSYFPQSFFPVFSPLFPFSFPLLFPPFPPFFFRFALQQVLSQNIGSDLFSPNSTNRRAGPISGGGHKNKQRLPRSYITERWKAPPLFRPIRIPSDHPNNSDAVSLHELIAGDYTEVLIATYLFSGRFILDALPRLKTVPLLIVQGVKDNT